MLIIGSAGIAGMPGMTEFTYHTTFINFTFDSLPSIVRSDKIRHIAFLLFRINVIKV